MKIIQLTQGTPEWLAHRRTMHNASEASVMRGEFHTFSRREFVRLRATGLDREFSDYVQKHILDRGHEVEPALRALAESMIGEDLYPVTGVSDDGYLGASFDGVTLGEDVILEAKQWSEGKADYLSRGEIPPQDYWQVVQQFAVCNSAERCLYLVGDGSEEGTVSLWINRDQIEHDIPKLIASWEQFDADVAAYLPGPAAALVPSGRAPESLPALSIQVTGMVTASNLAEFKDNALAVLGAINRELQTDEDFANAEQTVKWCQAVEDRLAATKDHVLSQTADIELVFRTMDEVSAETRRIRLELDKLVTKEKENRKLAIVTCARGAYTKHIEDLKAETNGAWIALQQPDFAGAIKGKRTLSSMQDAVDTALAGGKIAANESAKHIRAALACLAEETKGHEHLFPDSLTFIGKPAEDIKALVRGRIAEHKQREDERLDRERERIRQEEVARLEREAAARAAEQDTPKGVEASAAAEPATQPANPAPIQTGAARLPVGARMKLGDINGWIAPLTITADGLASLGFKAVATERSAKLYVASDLQRICQRLAEVVAQAPARAASKQAA